MFICFDPDDRILRCEAFQRDEVCFNLIHKIAGHPHNIRLTTPDRRMMFVHSAGFNPWLWISAELEPEERLRLARAAAAEVSAVGMPGITGTEEIAAAFAGAFCAGRGVNYSTHMLMEAYACPAVKSPRAVDGALQGAEKTDATVVARFLAGFCEDAYGLTKQAEHFAAYAADLAGSGNLYLWVRDGVPVSMAHIAHRSANHARINEVYTLRSERKKGYASAVVAGLSEALLAEGLTPMLYADSGNPDSNGVYRSIGFEWAGRVADLKFA